MTPVMWVARSRRYMRIVANCETEDPHPTLSRRERGKEGRNSRRERGKESCFIGRGFFVARMLLHRATAVSASFRFLSPLPPEEGRVRVPQDDHSDKQNHPPPRPRP